jgi:hypothetical protein
MRDNHAVSPALSANRRRQVITMMKQLAIIILSLSVTACTTERFQPQQPAPQQYQQPLRAPVPGAPFERDPNDPQIMRE